MPMNFSVRFNAITSLLLQTVGLSFHVLPQTYILEIILEKKAHQNFIPNTEIKNKRSASWNNLIYSNNRLELPTSCFHYKSL